MYEHCTWVDFLVFLKDFSDFHIQTFMLLDYQLPNNNH